MPGCRIPGKIIIASRAAGHLTVIAEHGGDLCISRQGDDPSHPVVVGRECPFPAGKSGRILRKSHHDGTSTVLQRKDAPFNGVHRGCLQSGKVGQFLLHHSRGFTAHHLRCTKWTYGNVVTRGGIRAEVVVAPRTAAHLTVGTEVRGDNRSAGGGLYTPFAVIVGDHPPFLLHQILRRCFRRYHIPGKPHAGPIGKRQFPGTNLICRRLLYRRKVRVLLVHYTLRVSTVHLGRRQRADGYGPLNSRVGAEVVVAPRTPRDLAIFHKFSTDTGPGHYRDKGVLPVMIDCKKPCRSRQGLINRFEHQKSRPGRIHHRQISAISRVGCHIRKKGKIPLFLVHNPGRRAVHQCRYRHFNGHRRSRGLIGRAVPVASSRTPHIPVRKFRRHRSRCKRRNHRTALVHIAIQNPYRPRYRPSLFGRRGAPADKNTQKQEGSHGSRCKRFHSPNKEFLL